MNTLDILNALAIGELSNLSLSGNGTSIAEAKRPQIILYLNEGLIRLYTRFMLKERMLLIEMKQHRTFYPIIKKYSCATMRNVPNIPEWDEPFILDLGKEPFNDDLVKITKVVSQTGNALPINDEAAPNSVFTPQNHILQVRDLMVGKLLAVTYQASHPSLSLTNLGQVVELPVALQGALRAYVASRVYSHMNSAESTAKAAEHLNMFDTICVEQSALDTHGVSSSDSSHRFNLGGWI